MVMKMNIFMWFPPKYEIAFLSTCSLSSLLNTRTYTASTTRRLHKCRRGSAATERPLGCEVWCGRLASARVSPPVMEGQGRAPLTLWAFVTRYDLTHTDVNGECNDNKPLVSLAMRPEWTARDVQRELKKTLKLDQSSVDSSLVLKVRNGEGMLLPMTPTALNSTSKQPLVVEVCAPHQHVTGTESDMGALPASFRKTVEGLISNYETRVRASPFPEENLAPSHSRPRSHSAPQPPRSLPRPRGGEGAVFARVPSRFAPRGKRDASTTPSPSCRVASATQTPLGNAGGGRDGEKDGKHGLPA
ncbi:hypothetical protein C7M84_012356 [Penaeus vannamei]|uniref:Uncharacterized protein n=1 Tax=Penaeus vannamei TaxID=6689 RepID=A0A423SZA3_PENVA|nr:hypothetical protein C7M84_012356 [Penaeus vannamei]